MTTLLGSFWRLGRRDKRIVLEAMFIVLAVRIGLELTAFGKLLAGLERLATKRGASGDDVPAERIAWAVETASRVGPGADTCLVRALTTATMLNRRGDSASVRLGIDRESGEGLGAHAWVESSGRVVASDRPDEAYKTRLPPIELGGS